MTSPARRAAVPSSDLTEIAARDAYDRSGASPADVGARQVNSQTSAVTSISTDGVQR